MELKLNMQLWISLGTEPGCVCIMKQELFYIKLPKDTRKLKQRKCYHANVSLHHCKEEEGILGSRQKASWALSTINTLNTRSPVVVSGKVILA